MHEKYIEKAIKINIWQLRKNIQSRIQFIFTAYCTWKQKYTQK